MDDDKTVLVRWALALVLTEHKKWLDSGCDGSLGGRGRRLVVPTGADLSEALFRGVNFTGAYLGHCTFTGTEFDGSNLRGIKYDEKTRLPRRESAEVYAELKAKEDRAALLRNRLLLRSLGRE